MNVLVPAHVTPNGDSEVLISMGQHHKLPMSRFFFPQRNSNEKQEGFLQLHSPHLLHSHSKAVQSGISSVSVLPMVHLIPLFVVLIKKLLYVLVKQAFELTIILTYFLCDMGGVLHTRKQIHTQTSQLYQALNIKSSRPSIDIENHPVPWNIGNVRKKFVDVMQQYLLKNAPISS